METQGCNSRKAVTFNRFATMAEFDKVTTEEANNIWFDAYELQEFRNEGKNLAYSYKIQCADSNCNDGDDDENNKELSSSDGGENDIFRGVEGSSFVRQTQKVLSNYCVRYAQRIGMTETEIASVYKECNQFSSEVAYVQALHDHRDAMVHHDATADPTTTRTVSTTQPSSSLLFWTEDNDQYDLYPVRTMVPPPPIPFAIQSVRAMRARTA